MNAPRLASTMLGYPMQGPALAALHCPMTGQPPQVGSASWFVTWMVWIFKDWSGAVAAMEHGLPHFFHRSEGFFNAVVEGVILVCGGLPESFLRAAGGANRLVERRSCAPFALRAGSD